MAFAATNSSKDPLSFSIGTAKVQIMTYSAASGDTSGTVTADRLYRVDQIFLDGSLVMTAAATFSANVATLAFSNPGATVYGTLICIGR